MTHRHAASTLWRVEALITNEPRGVYGVEHVVMIHKRSGESRDHVVLKLLGVLLFFHEGLVVEDRERTGVYRADVSRRGVDGQVQQWIECGDVSAFKLDRLTRALGAGVVVEVLKRGGAAATQLLEQLRAAAHPERVAVNDVDAGFVDDVGAALNRAMRSRVVAVIQGDGQGDRQGDAERDVCELAVMLDVDGVICQGSVRRRGWQV